MFLLPVSFNNAPNKLNKYNDKYFKSPKNTVFKGLNNDTTEISKSKISFVKCNNDAKISDSVFCELKTKEAKEIFKKSKGIYSEAQNTMNKLQTMVKEGVTNNFKGVKDENGNIIRDFSIGDEYGTITMDEYDLDGYVTRVTEFDTLNSPENNPYEIMLIETFTDMHGTTYDIINNSSDYVMVVKNHKVFDDGRYKNDEVFIFDRSGNLLNYCKNDRYFYMKASDEEFRFNNEGKLTEYYSGFKRLHNTYLYKTKIMFNDKEKPVQFKKNYTYIADN